MNLFALVLVLGFCLPARGDVALVTARWASRNSQHSLQTCALYNPQWGQLPTRASAALSMQAVLSRPATGCTADGQLNITNVAEMRGAAALFVRNCTFSTTVTAAAHAGAKAVIILNSKDADVVAPGAANDSDYAAAGNIAVAMVDYNTGQAFMQAVGQGQLTVDIYAVEPSAFDWSSVLFLLLALAAITCGSLWQTSAARKKLHRLEAEAEGHALLPVDDHGKDKKEEEGADLSVTFVLVFLLIASITLVLLYLFYKYLVYVVIAIFVFASGSAVARLLEVAALRWAPRLVHPTARNAVNLPCFGPTTYAHLLFMAIGYSMSITWVVIRHRDSSWILQDMLGVCCLLSALEIVRLPSFKVGTVLLSIFFFYDVFFVFITPYLTPKHDSVMVTAATGGSGATEAMPLVLRLPRFHPVPCYRAESLLGYGDVVIPGICVAHALSFDIDRTHRILRESGTVARSFWTRYGFFVTGLCAYTLGLVLTYVGMTLMSTAQPALMYLSPSLLLCLWGRAWCLGCAADLWRGSPPRPAPVDDDEEGGDSDASTMVDDSYGGVRTPVPVGSINSRRSQRSPAMADGALNRLLNRSNEDLVAQGDSVA